MEAKWRLKRRLEKQEAAKLVEREYRRQISCYSLVSSQHLKVRVDNLAGRGQTIRIEKAETNQSNFSSRLVIETNSPTV